MDTLSLEELRLAASPVSRERTSSHYSTDGDGSALLGCTQPYTLYADWVAEQDDPDATVRRVASAIPLERIAEPADVAAAVAYLASPGASYVTGVSIPVDGGYLAT